MKERILVWDLPTRVFHWLLALSFAGAFITADSERTRDVHVLLGYTFAGLLVFRLLWGFIGTRYARFRSFRYRLTDVRAYLASLFTRAPRHYIGHNPAGSIAIYLMLLLGVTTAVIGLAVYNDYGGEWLAELHEATANAMLVVVLVHIAGVLVSSMLHGENLVRSMINGRKLGDHGQGIRSARAWTAALLLAVVAGIWYSYPQLPGIADVPAYASSAHYDEDD